MSLAQLASWCRRNEDVDQLLVGAIRRGMACSDAGTGRSSRRVGTVVSTEPSTIAVRGVVEYDGMRSDLLAGTTRRDAAFITDHNRRISGQDIPSRFGKD